MMVLFLFWSWIYLKLLPSTLLMYQLLLFSPLLLVAKIPLHSVEFNHCRSWRGERKKTSILFLMPQEGRERPRVTSPPKTCGLALYFHGYNEHSASHGIHLQPSTAYLCQHLPHNCGSQGLRGMERSHEQSQGRIPGCHIARKWEKE